MPSLPRIKRSRTVADAAGVAPAPRALPELDAHGLTWVHLDRPMQEEMSLLAERFARGDITDEEYRRGLVVLRDRVGFDRAGSDGGR